MPDEQSTPPPYDPGRRVNTGLAGETTRNEGSTILPEARQRPSEVIGDFEVLGKLGQGGMGAVYRARQISLDRQVALKILPPNFEADADYVARFQREARIAASLNHANLVKVYASGAADGCHYIAMELIEGETLSQWLKRAALPPLEALRITLDVAQALECGWRTAQLIHRDIKPGNIFLSTTGEVKLGDLGLAKIVGSDTTGLTHTGMAMGTPHYISPEQARGDKDLDIRADIYSLGCTLYQMLTGQTPYIGTEPMVVMNQHINAPPPAILKVMPQCPLPLARLVSKMLKKPRRERYANYNELITAIETVHAQLDPTRSAPTIPALSSTHTPPPPQTPLPSTPTAPSPPPKSRMPVYGGVGVLALALAAFFLWPRPDKLTKAQIYARDHASEQAAARADAELLAQATKDAPFENTLGMKFAPVPIAGGPSAGQRVLFSVWDTRMRDYAAYAAANPKADGAWRTAQKDGVPTGRELDYPVGAVSWDDAQAFCQWLTQKEIAEGKLPKGLRYRLPTDEEWSWAVGLPAESGATPGEKRWRNNEDFPWGKDYPPQEKVGNYADEAFHAKFPPKKNEKENRMENQWIEGYDDGYATASPVGSFPANAYGLYDMGGNVVQWCEDWYDASHEDRVMRGAGWGNFHRAHLLSSNRWRYEPTARYNGLGFRCVLGVSTPPAAVAAAAGGTRSVASPASGGEGGTKVGAERASPSTATKDAPFENTLGMKFVPVPGTKVLFSIWDTRVQDYAAYAGAKNVDDSWTKMQKDGVPVSREPDYPVAGVSWDDARAFCQWLTEKDTAEGTLPKGAKYRLPTDEEWSVAVGLPPELGTTPAEKIAKNTVDFPWGKDYPPKGKVGNYADEAFHAKFPLSENSKEGWGKNRWIEGYSDGYATTSPVGSFPANGDGLYDMGGNVWQWCEDWFDATHTDRVLRGASWDHYDRGYLLSSHRSHNVPAHRYYNHGFRCVLDVSVAPTQSVSTTPAAEPWQDAPHDPSFTSRGTELTPQALRFSGSGTAGISVARRDSAVRIVSAFDPAAQSLYLRVRGSARGAYVLYLRSNGSALRLLRSETGQKEGILLREIPLSSPVRPGQEYSMELRAVGSTLSVKFDGNILGEVVDTTFPSGTNGLDHSDKSPALVKTFEYLNLDSREAEP